MGIGEKDRFLASISPYLRQGLVEGLHRTHVRPTDTRLSSISCTHRNPKHPTGKGVDGPGCGSVVATYLPKIASPLFIDLLPSRYRALWSDGRGMKWRGRVFKIAPFFAAVTKGFRIISSR